MGRQRKFSVASCPASADFASRWETVQQTEQRDMATTTFRNRTDASLSAVVSRAKQPGERLDRVQVLVTATFERQN